VTNNMSAEYGRSAGGVINVAYRSGTNRFSGAAWEFFRDTSLNATGFFKPATGGKPPLSRDQFGFTFGGPLLRNRAFFFSDYEGYRQNRGNVSFATIPNETQRQGILPVSVINPLTGQTYAAGTPIQMTSFARKVLSELPAPTSAGAANNYSILQEFTNTTDKWNVKSDVQIRGSLTAFGRFGYRDADLYDQPPIPLPSGGGGNAQTYVTNKQFVTGFTWTRSASALLEGRFGWSGKLAFSSTFGSTRAVRMMRSSSSRAARSGATRPGGRSRKSGWATAPTISPTSFRAGSDSASPSPARWSTIPRSCSPTSPPATWIPPPRRRS